MRPRRIFGPYPGYPLPFEFRCRTLDVPLALVDSTETTKRAILEAADPNNPANKRIMDLVIRHRFLAEGVLRVPASRCAPAAFRIHDRAAADRIIKEVEKNAVETFTKLQRLFQDI